MFELVFNQTYAIDFHPTDFLGFMTTPNLLSTNLSQTLDHYQFRDYNYLSSFLTYKWKNSDFFVVLPHTHMKHMIDLRLGL